MSAHEFPTASDYLQLHTIRQTQQYSCALRQGSHSKANASGIQFPTGSYLYDFTTGFVRSVYQQRNKAFQDIPEKKGVSILSQNVTATILFVNKELGHGRKYGL